MTSQKDFLINLKSLQKRMDKACERAGRIPDQVKLMAVTKTNPAECVDWAVSAGIRCIGENRVQEASAKRPLATVSGANWELIGPLQSNKCRLAMETFDRIQTIDRIKLVNALDRICLEMQKKEFPVLMQVNVSEDPAKSGCEADQALELAEAIIQSQNLVLEGLMTIGIYSDEEKVVRPTFIKLRNLRDQLEQQLCMKLPELSMGMTGDLEWAIEEGSTLIRVGTALFGERAPYDQPAS